MLRIAFSGALRQPLATFLGVALLIHAAPAFGGTMSAADRAKAKEHFERGKSAFEAKDYPTAAMAYTQAYEIMPLPGLLFNIAQCYRNLKQYPEAIALFSRYLKEAPDAPNRAAVERLVAELKAKLGDSAPSTPEAAPPTPEPPSPPPPVPPPPPVEQIPTQPATQPSQRTQQDDQTAEPLVKATPDGQKEQHDRADGAPPIYARWWFWTAIGVVVAGGVTAALLATQKSDPDIAPSRFPTWQLPDISR